MPEDRRAFIGGSDIAAVLGISPWQTAVDIYSQKVGLLDGSLRRGNGQVSRVLNRGKRLEPYILQMLEDETGLKVVRRNVRYRHPKIPFLAAEIDGEPVEPENVECKSVSPWRMSEWGEAGTDHLPIYYTSQCQYGLGVTGREVCIVAVLFGADDFRVYEVHRDEDIIRQLEEKAVAFWENHVLPRIPPPPTTALDLLKIYPQHRDLVLECNEDLLHTYLRLKNAHAEKKELEQEIERAEFTLKNALGDASAFEYQGQTLLTWRTQKSRRVDVTALQEVYPDIADKFRKESVSRVFRLK